MQEEKRRGLEMFSIGKISPQKVSILLDIPAPYRPARSRRTKYLSPSPKLGELSSASGARIARISSVLPFVV